MIPQKTKDLRERLFVVLVRPESLENIGLAARAMKNTGFRNLRVVGRKKVEIACPRTAVHAKEIIKEAAFFSDLASATNDLDVIFASTAKRRKNFSVGSLAEAIAKISSFPKETRIGLLFGNERTGLTSAELSSSNFRWSIPQAARQPSYNLAAAVLITLFELFRRVPEAGAAAGAPDREIPLPRSEQEDCIRRILQKLEQRRFIHLTNKRHTAQMVRDLLGRLAMTDRDRKLLLAMFSHAGKDD
jgi:TrmH family RNA methyltransferase